MPDRILHKEMGYSRTEFLQQFKQFAHSNLQQMTYNIDSNRITIEQITIEHCSARIIIDFKEQEQRKLGALLLPRLYLSFQFENYSMHQQEKFLSRFNRSFQRGGG